MKKYLFFFFLPFVFFSCSLTETKPLGIKINGDEEISYYISDGSGQKVYSFKKNDLIYAYPKTDTIFLKVNGKNYNFVLDQDKEQICVDNRVNFKFIKQKAFLCITYDDCPATDWNAYQKIHKQYDSVIPAELGLNINRRALPIEQMKIMVEDGFEIVNHSTSHHRLERVGLQKAVSKEDNKIYGWFTHTFLDGAELFIGEETYKIVSHGSDSNGNYFAVDRPFLKNYGIGTSIQLSDEALNNELFYGVEDIEKQLGTKINHFTYPYTVSDKRTRKLIEETNKYYSCRAYNGYYSDGKTKNLFDPGLNYFPFENKLTLNSASFDLYYSEEEIKTIFEKAAKTKAMVIQFNHTWDSNFKIEKMKYLIDTALDMGIEITTRTPIWDYYEINELSNNN